MGRTMFRVMLPSAMLCCALGGMAAGFFDIGSADFMKCRITAADPAAAGAFFETGDYRFDSPRASVMSGRKGGLYIMAEKPLTGGDRLQATIQLLNGSVFEAARRGNDFQCRLPRVPCTLTDRDFGASDAPLRGLRHFPYIALQRYIRRDTATFSVKSLCFNRFTMHITECRME
ncbi:MAG: hypothetical protein JXA20_14095, partial [Spirochaetes bacterium]|nr:hypothetical protein [Spirochaetota bacterium]